MARDIHILHVRTHANPASVQLDAAGRDQGARITHAEDCYAAVAQMVRAEPGFYDFLAVHLNDLSVSDREFFQLVSHRFRESPVYIYGSGWGETNVDWALGAGATGQLEPCDLSAIFETIPHARRKEDDTSAMPRDETRLTDLLVDEMVRPRTAESSGVPQESSMPQDSEEPLVEADEDAPPQESEESTDHESPQQRPMRRKKLSAPPPPGERKMASLLTEEEIEALLGDDSGRSVEQQDNA